MLLPYRFHLDSDPPPLRPSKPLKSNRPRPGTAIEALDINSRKGKKRTREQGMTPALAAGVAEIALMKSRKATRRRAYRGGYLTQALDSYPIV